MFTGIVRVIGTVRARRRVAAGVSFAVSGLGVRDGVAEGDSVAVNGVCQTVEKVDADVLAFTAVGETLARTTLGSLRAGSRVNLETAARPDSPLGGHFVQGHVDAVGRVQSFVRTKNDWILRFRIPAGLARFVAAKGSIAVDGVSLTVIDCSAAGLVRATIVPFTMEHTVIGSYRPGTRVNVETDILGKYVRRSLEGTRPGGL